jgi:hypothetical protein
MLSALLVLLSCVFALPAITPVMDGDFTSKRLQDRPMLATAEFLLVKPPKVGNVIADRYTSKEMKFVEPNQGQRVLAGQKFRMHTKNKYIFAYKDNVAAFVDLVNAQTGQVVQIASFSLKRFLGDKPPAWIYPSFYSESYADLVIPTSVPDGSYKLRFHYECQLTKFSADSPAIQVVHSL